MTISSFQGPYRFLSNFWPCQIWFEDDTYPSVEHAYQAAKTLVQAERDAIRRCVRSGQAKWLGQKLTLRPGWLDYRVDLMGFLVGRKFILDNALSGLLRQTKPELLVEGNNWGDQFWGVCDGQGENHLGRILMSVREIC